jgi:hypothetical protein
MFPAPTRQAEYLERAWLHFNQHLQATHPRRGQQRGAAVGRQVLVADRRIGLKGVQDASIYFIQRHGFE